MAVRDTKRIYMYATTGPSFSTAIFGSGLITKMITRMHLSGSSQLGTPLDEDAKTKDINYSF